MALKFKTVACGLLQCFSSWIFTSLQAGMCKFSFILSLAGNAKHLIYLDNSTFQKSFPNALFYILDITGDSIFHDDVDICLQ